MINKLVEKIKKTGAPIVVGLDPMLSYVPEHIQKKSFDEYGETPVSYTHLDKTANRCTLYEGQKEGLPSEIQEVF